MTEPTQNEESTKQTRPKGGSATSGAGQPAPKSAAADAPASQSGGSSTSSGAAASASQLTGAVSGAMSDLMTRLQRSEQMALTGAGLVLGVYIVFQFLLDKPTLSDNSVVVALLMVLTIWVHRWGHFDFGSAYRITLAGLSIALAAFAIINFLGFIRAGGNAGDFMALLGRILYWAGGLIAFVGSWQLFRTRE